MVNGLEPRLLIGNYTWYLLGWQINKRPALSNAEAGQVVDMKSGDDGSTFP